MNRYLVYLRVSSDKQTIANQREALQRYIDYHQHTEPYQVLWFEDEAVSATHVPLEKRTQLQAVLKEATKGDTVLIYSIDRLGRDIVEQVIVMRKIIQAGAKLKSKSEDGIDNPLIFNILASVAEDGRRQMAQKVKDALAVKKARGHRYSGHMPYGSRMCPVTKVNVKKDRSGNEVKKHGLLLPHASELEMMKMVYNLSLQGLSCNQIAKLLNAHGYRNRAGRDFAAMTVHRIVQSQKSAELIFAS